MGEADKGVVMEIFALLLGLGYCCLGDGCASVLGIALLSYAVFVESVSDEADRTSNHCLSFQNSKSQQHPKLYSWITSFTSENCSYYLVEMMPVPGAAMV